MTTPDYCEVTWSPTRAAEIVRMTVDEIPFEECDEAAHQLLVCGNLARRMNTRPRDDGYVSVAHSPHDPEPTETPLCTTSGCGHPRSDHAPGEHSRCITVGCPCRLWKAPWDD